jgi:hypothetical protein
LDRKIDQAEKYPGCADPEERRPEKAGAAGGDAE